MKCTQIYALLPNISNLKLTLNLKYFLHELNYCIIDIKFHTKTLKVIRNIHKTKKATDLYTILLKFNELQCAY